MTEPAKGPNGAVVTGMRRWEQISDELPFTQLERSRSAADKWLATISALTGLTGLLTLLSSQARLTSLSPYGEWGVGALLALAFVCALVAIFQGALAAQGKSMTLLNDPIQVRNWYKTETQDAARALQLSRWTALVAAVLGSI